MSKVKYTLKNFIIYVLMDKTLSVKEIHEEIKKIPCENPWSDDSKTPENTISSRCTRLFNNGILDREKLNNICYVYWLK
jgi:hypothetical protein